MPQLLPRGWSWMESGMESSGQDALLLHKQAGFKIIKAVARLRCRVAQSPLNIQRKLRPSVGRAQGPGKAQSYLRAGGRRDGGGFFSSVAGTSRCSSSYASVGRWGCKSPSRQGGTAKMVKRACFRGKAPLRFLQIPVEEEARCHQDPAGEEEAARRGATSSVVCPHAQQPLLPWANLTPFTHLSRQIYQISQLVAA